jgi:hypothetical protein
MTFSIIFSSRYMSYTNKYSGRRKIIENVIEKSWNLLLFIFWKIQINLNENSKRKLIISTQSVMCSTSCVSVYWSWNTHMCQVFQAKLLAIKRKKLTCHQGIIKLVWNYKTCFIISCCHACLARIISCFSFVSVYWSWNTYMCQVVCNTGMNFMKVHAFLLKGWFSSEYFVWAV